MRIGIPVLAYISYQLSFLYPNAQRPDSLRSLSLVHPRLRSFFYFNSGWTVLLGYTGEFPEPEW